MLSTTVPPLLGEIDQLYGKCVVLTSIQSDGWMTLAREKELEREREGDYVDFKTFSCS